MIWMARLVGYGKGSAHKRYYTVYLRSTDEIVCTGDALECANAMHRSLTGFYTMVSRTKSGKNKRYEVYSEPYYEMEDGT